MTKNIDKIRPTIGRAADVCNAHQTPSRALVALAAVLDLTTVVRLPKSMTAAVDRLALAAARADTCSTDLAPAPLTGADLLADDWLQRVTAHRQARNVAAVDAVDIRVAVFDLARVCAQEAQDMLPELVRALTAWLTEHWDDVARDGISMERSDPTLTPGQAADLLDRRRRLATMFRVAHRAVLAAGGGTPPHDYAGPYVLTHVWTYEQYQHLVDQTRAALEPFGDQTHLLLAQRCGATLRLAGSWTEVAERLRRMQTNDAPYEMTDREKAAASTWAGAAINKTA